MGVGVSFYQFIPAASHDPQNGHCVLAFTSNADNEMTLIHGVMELKDSIMESIHRSWPQGLQRQPPSSDAVVVFKFRGRPFQGQYLGTGIKPKLLTARLLCAILDDAMRRGWRLCAMVNMHQRSKTESMILARGCREDIRPPIVALVLSSFDRIAMVGLPQHLHDTLVRLVEKNWPQGIDSSKPHEPDAFAVTMKRWPFSYTDIGDNLFNSRKLILDIIREIYIAGFELYGAGHPEMNIEEVSTLYFGQSQKPDYAPRMFLLAPHVHDYLITVDAPEECVSTLRNCIMENWPKQIDNERSYKGLHAIKMNGYPFHTSGVEGVCAVRMLIRTFEELRRRGWRLEGTFDMNSNLKDTSTFLMVQSPPEDVNLMAVKLSGSDALILVNASADIEGAVRAELNAAYRPDVVGEKEVEDCPKFFLKRRVHQSQAVICLVISRIESLGFKLVSSADMNIGFGQRSGKGHHQRWPLDLHTMFFEKSCKT